MPSLPSVNHLDVVRALQKLGFSIVRQGRHIILSDGTGFISMPRHNPVNANTMGAMVRIAGLTNAQFRKLL